MIVQDHTIPQKLYKLMWSWVVNNKIGVSDEISESNYLLLTTYDLSFLWIKLYLID